MGLRDSISDAQEKISEIASQWIAEVAGPKVRKAVDDNYTHTKFPAPDRRNTPTGVLLEIIRQLIEEDFNVTFYCCKPPHRPSVGWVPFPREVPSGFNQGMHWENPNKCMTPGCFRQVVEIGIDWINAN